MDTLEPESVIAGVYRIVRLLGRGGAGEVYEAVHQRTGASLAIKILRAGFLAKSEAFARFQREAEVTSRLHHPNIVKVFDFDCLPDGRPFLVMELLSGTDLGTIIKAREPFPPARVLAITEQVAMALATTHGMGVVHRDLSPGNIFIEKLDGTDREIVRVLDFGISKVRNADGGLTHTTTIMGTPYYMSPEQAQGHAKETDPRADQFALGAIVYEMFAGRRAFSSDDPASDDPATAILYRVVHHDPPAFAALGVDLPASLEAVVLKALAKDPAQRYSSVLDFSDALIAAAWEAGLTEERIDLGDDDLSSARAGGAGVDGGVTTDGLLSPSRRRSAMLAVRNTGPTWTTPPPRTTARVFRPEGDTPIPRRRAPLSRRSIVIAGGALAGIAVVIAAAATRAPRRAVAPEASAPTARTGPASAVEVRAAPMAASNTAGAPPAGLSPRSNEALVDARSPAAAGHAADGHAGHAGNDDVQPPDRRPARRVSSVKPIKRARTVRAETGHQQQRTRARPRNEDIY
jgi:serine/threonine-protein kinase